MLITVTLLVPLARAEIVGIEPFVYADGPIAGKAAGSYWDFKNVSPVAHTGISSTWSNDTGAPNVISGKLVTTNNSARRQYNGASESDGAVNEFNVNKQVYYRVTVTTGPTLPTFFGLSSYDFASERIFFGKTFGSANFGIQDAVLLTNSVVPVAPNTTYVLVARLDYDDNLIRLYVNPDLGASEPATAPVSASYTDTYWSTEVRLASGTGGTVTWDDLVVANEWENLRSLVTTTADEDNGSSGGGTGVSLREAVKYSFPGARIYFPAGHNGATITLTNEIVFNLNASIDASHLASGLTINGGPGTNRIFTVSSGKAAALDNLTMTGGNAGSTTIPGAGGAIYNDVGSTLGLARCTLTGNTGDLGGALGNLGTATISQCLFASNSAAHGGAIHNEDVMTLINCTLVGNHANAYGGAIEIQDSTSLSHCTITGNDTAAGGGGGGGGIDIYNAGAVSLANCIVAGNSSPGGADIQTEGSALNWQSANINQSTFLVSGTITGPSPINANPLLAPLGNYGGPTRTMPPLPGSPAINAALGSTTVVDQRGLPRPSGAAADIGAVEVRGLTQDVIYDSFGFESPRFTLGNLTGQDGANGTWVQTGSGTATVQSTNVNAGAQAVRVARTGTDSRFSVVKQNLNVGSSPTPIIAVEWTMKYTAANLPLGSFGPNFGMEIYDGFGIGYSLAASAFVDAATQELIYQQPGNGFLAPVPGVLVPPDTWHSYRLELDYATQTYRLIYDGREVLANAFVDPGITDFTDADIAAVAGGGDPASQAATGTAYFDSYKVTAQSEPAHILAIAKTGANQATLSWTPTTSGSLLLESPQLTNPTWTLAPSVSSNPVTVNTVSNKFHRLYRP